jgi:hypothetical protein
VTTLAQGHKKEDSFPLKVTNLSKEMEIWVEEAERRIFSLGTGDRISPIAKKIMQIGFGKILYAASELGADLEQCNPYIVFAPDCTCTFNKMRVERGFSYGALIKGEFSGMISTSNSMPNACGYTIAELTTQKTDVSLKNHLTQKQKEIGKDHLQQLGKGNHFSAVYCVKDAITGEDTMRRMINVHSSGKLGTQFLYDLSWLCELEGYHRVDTPHGPIELLEGDAKKSYLDKYNDGDKKNADYRFEVLGEILGEGTFRVMEEITHQGLSKNGKYHRLGVQVHDGLIPIAFNSEEGLILAETKQNLSKELLETWKYKEQVEEMDLKEELSQINFSPHGGGYEFLYPVKKFTLHLDKKGICFLEAELKPEKKPTIQEKVTYFRELKEYMCFRRKLPLMREVFRADLIKHIYDLEPLMQIYPLVSIVGGTL